MAGDEVLGHAHGASHTTHFVLEEPLQRFAEREVHLLGKSAHIVVALDDLTRDVEAFDAVGVDGSLRQPACVGNLAGFGVEDFHKVAADDLAFLFRLLHSRQVAEELFRSVYANDVEAEAFVVAHDIVELVLPEHTVVDKDAGKLATDGLVQQYGCHTGVNSARKSEDDAVAANLLAELTYGGFHEGVGTPVLLRTADSDHEVLQQQRTLEGVEHLRMELYAPHFLCTVGGRDVVCGILHRFGRGNDVCTFRNACDGVAVAHPNLAVMVEALEEGILRIYAGKMLASVFARACRLHLSAPNVAHELCAVADAEDGQTAADA